MDVQVGSTYTLADIASAPWVAISAWPGAVLPMCRQPAYGGCVRDAGVKVRLGSRQHAEFRVPQAPSDSMPAGLCC